jgi:hypothetical protein
MSGAKKVQHGPAREIEQKFMRAQPGTDNLKAYWGADHSPRQERDHLRQARARRVV